MASEIIAILFTYMPPINSRMVKARFRKNASFRFLPD